jgi:hypothetical protein
MEKTCGTAARDHQLDGMKRWFKSYRCLILSLAVLSLLALGCSRHQQIVLKSRDGSRRLVYDADVFIPQANTGEDMQLLRDSAWQIIQLDPNDVITGTALKTAMTALPTPDFKELERVIYNYKVEQLKKDD